MRDVRAAAPDLPKLTGTLRDVLHRQPRGACFKGPKLQFTSVTAGTVSNQRRRCRGADCARCMPGWAGSQISKALRGWDGAPVHRSVFLPEGRSWRDTARGRAIVAQYPKGEHGYVRIAVGTDGESWVFHPGPIDSHASEPVPAPGIALADALLHAPERVRRVNGGKGVQRITNNVVPPPAQSSGDSERTAPADLHTVRMRPDTCIEEDVLRRAEVRLGRPIQWDTNRQRSDTTHEWNLSDVPESEVLLHREVAEEQRMSTPAERAERKTTEWYRENYPGLFSGLRS